VSKKVHTIKTATRFGIVFHLDVNKDSYGNQRANGDDEVKPVEET
jgi:hypothetical protein